jgi:hypothetical protein
MLHVIERIVTLLAVGAGEAGENTAEDALKQILAGISAPFHENTIHSITNTAGDYTIEFSKPGNITHFTIKLTIYAGHTSTEYVGKGPSGNFVMIKTENDLVSYMANA